MSNKREPVYISKRDHEAYSLTIGTKLDADGLPQKVYQLKNSEHYCECTKDQFKNEFEQQS